MDMTDDQIATEFKRQVRLCSGLGYRRMSEILLRAIASNDLAKGLTGPPLISVHFFPLSGAGRILRERIRQIDELGYSDAHDDQHDPDDLLAAAECYSNWAAEQLRGRDPERAHGRLPDWWPWEDRDWKPSSDPVRNLEKAGALVAATIDRILRESRRSEDVASDTLGGGSR